MPAIATQDYGWSQLARREGLGWPEGTEWAMRQAAAAGIAYWEPFLAGPADATRIGALAQAAGLSMSSVFVAGPLHAEGAAAALDRMVETVSAAKVFGCSMAMVYPLAAEHGDKDDSQLTAQARNLETLARRLQTIGVRTLYHCEEPDFRNAAREFHHMIAGTEPALVRVCLDPDAIWRGAGQSLVALMDIARLYGDRVEALHLRQSQNGIPDETIGPGDIDHPALAAILARNGGGLHLVVEHVYDDATPATLDLVEAYRRSALYVASVFG